MRQIGSLFTCLAMVGVLFASAAFAQDAPAQKPDAPPKTAPDKKPDGATDHAKPEDVATAMQAAKLTLAQAVAAAEEHSKGHAIGAWGDVKDKQATVTVHCVVGDKCMAVTVDHAGKPTGMKEADAEHAKVHNGAVADVWAAFSEAKMTLARALRAEAEHHPKGTIVAATGKFHGKRPEVYFTCVRDGKVLKSETDKSWKVRDLKSREEADQGPVKDAKKGEQPAEPKKP